MDTSAEVYIGLALAGCIGTVVWYFVRRVLVNLDTNNQAINGRAKQDDLEALRMDLSEFKVQANREFVSHPALMQIMTSLDRTIQQLTNAITHNSQEAREGMNALNKRIDDMMQRKS
jgi:transglutaminase-like putative cysteine protease